MAKRGFDRDDWRSRGSFRDEERDYDDYDQRGSYPSRRGSHHSKKGNRNNRCKDRPASSNSYYRDGRDGYGSDNSTCSEPPLGDRKYSSDKPFSDNPSKNIGKSMDVCAPKQTANNSLSNSPNSNKQKTQTQTSSKEEKKVHSVKPDNLVTPNKDTPVGNDSSAKSNSQGKIMNKDPPPLPISKSTSLTNPTLPPTGKLEQAYKSQDQGTKIPPTPVQGGNKPPDKKATTPSNQEANIPPAQGTNILLPAQGENLLPDQKEYKPGQDIIPINSKASPPKLQTIPFAFKFTSQGINSSPRQSQTFQPITGSNVLKQFQIPNLRTSNESISPFQENKNIPGPVTTNQPSFKSFFFKSKKEHEKYISGVNPITQGNSQEVSPPSQPTDPLTPMRTSGKPPKNPTDNIPTPQHPPTDDKRSSQDTTEANNTQNFINTRPSNQLTTPGSGTKGATYSDSSFKFLGSPSSSILSTFMSEEDPSQLLEKLKPPDITDIMGHNQFLKFEIEEKNSLIAKIERDLKVLNLEVYSISAENQNLGECLSNSRESQKEIFNQTLETNRQEIATLRENNLNYETKISENNRRIQTLDGNIVQQNEKYSERESELLTEIAKFTKSLSTIERSLRAANDTILELNSDLIQSQKRYTEVRAELDLLQTAHKKLTMDKNALDLSVAEMREYIDSTTAERDALVDKQNTLNKQSMSLKSENKFLTNKVMSLDKQLNELAEIQVQPLSVLHANYFGDLDISHSCLDKFNFQSPSASGDQLHAKALEHLLHLQKLNWSLQEEIDDLTN